MLHNTATITISRGSRGTAAWSMCALLLLTCACTSTRRELVTDTHCTRADAERSTEQQNWTAAAGQWYSVFLAEKGESVDACLQAALALERSGKGECATHVLDLGLRAHPESAVLWQRRGEVLVGQGYERAAEPSFVRAVEAAPQSKDAVLELARVRLHLGWESSACDALRGAVERGIGDHEIVLMLASALGTREPMEAYRYYQLAFRTGEARPNDLVNAARLCLDDGVRKERPDALDQMRAWLDQAIASAPRCSEAHLELGLLCEELNEGDQAIAHYTTALEIDPQSLMALNNLAILYSARADAEHARPMVERALALESRPERRVALQQLLQPTPATIALVP